MDPIRTRWHRAHEALKARRVLLSTRLTEAEPVDELPGALNRVGLESFFEIFDAAPKYYIEKDTLDAIYARPDQVLKSLVAMGEAGVFKLPFPYMLVEYDWGGPTILGLSESTHPPANMEDCKLRATALQLISYQPGEALLLSPQTFYVSHAYRDEAGEPTMRWRSYLGGWVNRTPDVVRYGHETTEYWKPEIEPGLIASMLLLNTRGLVKEVVEPKPRLNAARKAKGKPPIPTHTVIRIGHVYTRQGKTVQREEHLRRKQPLHLRAGYTAVRWITKKHERWEAEKAGPDGKHSLLVYVEPYMVNYDPLSDDLPDIPERVVRW